MFYNGLCGAAFQTFFCMMAFPQCIQDPVATTVFYQQPICYDTCLGAENACLGNSDLAKQACSKMVSTGLVAPPNRPDVACTSA